MLELRRGVFARRFQPDPTDPRYSCEDGMGMEREVQELLYGFVRALKPPLVVETGAYIGGTAEVVGNALHDNGSGFLISIEIDERKAALARGRVCHLNRVYIQCADTFQFAKDYVWLYGGYPISMLIVDGAEDRLGEHLAFEPYLADDAIVFRHDTITGMKMGQLELAQYETLILPTARGLSVSQWEHWSRQQRGRQL